MADKRVRTVFYSEEFDAFLKNLDMLVREKYIWTIHVVETIKVLPTKYVKKLESTELYEMRISIGYNEYRTLLFAMDSDNVITATEIYLLNSFIKKDTKDYKRQIDIAEKLMKDISQ
jgi:phage-related protein